VAASANTQQRANWIVRFYTRARKVPTLIGKLPDGTPLPFGPYTGLQLITSVGTLIVLFKTREIWAFAGGLIDLLLAVAVAFAVGKIAGRFETGFHNPVVLASGAMASLTQPRHGTSGGRPVRMPRTLRTTGRIVVQARTAQQAQPAPAQALEVKPANQRHTTRRAEVMLPPATTLPTTTPQISATADNDATDRLTGLQALLAQSGTRRT
jgi:hypothetical protein